MSHMEENNDLFALVCIIGLPRNAAGSDRDGGEDSWCRSGEGGYSGAD
jgi:hypothetical protein